MSELTDAIKQGDTAKIEALIAADPSLAGKAENNVTPILLAIGYCVLIPLAILK